MAQKTNLNVSPYYDDFNKDKNFQNILFRPGYAIQAREMSQIQSLLKHKIEKVGDHLFKDGAMVVPGQISLFVKYTAIRIQNTFSGETVKLAQYVSASDSDAVLVTGVTVILFFFLKYSSTKSVWLYFNLSLGLNLSFNTEAESDGVV